jgi:selenocysteine lyase/cysteine desulfurase
MEHNAVMRPLLQMEGVSFDRIPCSREGLLHPADIEDLIRPNTKLLVMAHGSNVCGSVQDAKAVGELCAKHNIAFLLDAAQTAGHYPVDFAEFQLSALCVPGHKGLLGPSGIGALLMTDAFARALSPIVAGGTGSASDSEYLPAYLPDRFESGTPNLPGIYGWEAALRFVEEQGINALREHEMDLCRRFLEGLENIEGVALCGTKDLARRVGVISVDFLHKDNAEVAFELETDYGILTRCGLHCAPSAHKTLDTFPRGTVRFSLGFASTESDVDAALAAIAAISEV